MGLSIRSRLLLAFAAGLVLLGTIVALTYRATQRLVNAVEQATTMSTELVELEQILSSVRSAETSQRGFLLTGREAYLEPFDAAIRRLTARRAELSALDDGQSPAVREIDRLVGAKLDELQSTITTYRNQGREAAMAIVLTGRGRALMDSLRDAIREREGAEYRTFDAVADLGRERANTAIAAVSALSAVGLAVLGALFVTLLRYLNERARAEAGLTAERLLLEQRVGERTAELESERGRAETAAASTAQALSDRLASDEARHASEAQYRTLVEQVKDYAIFRLAPDGHAASWNEGVARVLGYTEEEFIGLPPGAIFTPEDQARGVPTMELTQAAKTGTANDDRWMMRKDGTRFFALGMTTALHDDAGRLIGFTKVMRDQTSWKRSEEALRESETRYRLVARASREAIWDWDMESGHVEWNDGVEGLFQYRRMEVPPTVDWWTAQVHPDDRERVVSSIDAAIERGDEFWTEDYRFLRADGQFALVTDRGVIARSAAGKACRMLGTMADITERRRNEDNLAQSQRMEAVGRLAGGVAHDLNNMLTAIVGYSTFVERSLPAGDPRQSDVVEIRKAAERSAALTRSLLAFARREIIRPRALVVNDIVRDMERMLRPALGENIQLELALAPSAGTVFADRARLEQVMLNLALNARDAMPGGGRLTIATSSTLLNAEAAARYTDSEVKPGPYTQLRITDTGHGMDANTLARAFEPFFTTKPVGEGTGLGLAAVYGTVKQAGGFVVAYSEPGHGASFAIYLPESAEDAHAEPEARPAAAPAGGSETVLIVEDEAMVRALADRTLASGGYECLAAADAAEGLALLDKLDRPVQLVVTDIVMPGMSGGEFAVKLADRYPETRVLFTSGFTDDEVVRRGLMERGRPFLQKPWAPEALLRRVRQVLDQ